MGQTCKTCYHPSVQEIGRALVAGEPYRSVAKHFEASPPSVYRHQQDHLRAAMLKAVEAEDVAHGSDLLGQVLELQQKALGILAEAQAAGDLRTALIAVREVRGTLELAGKLTGELMNRTEHSGQVEVRHRAEIDPEILLRALEEIDRIKAKSQRELPEADVIDGAVVNGAREG